MKINLWYSEEVDQWRWTLTSDTYTSIMESGNSEELREAMDDVATTVEWLLDTELTEQYNRFIGSVAQLDRAIHF